MCPADAGSADEIDAAKRLRAEHRPGRLRLASCDLANTAMFAPYKVATSTRSGRAQGPDGAWVNDYGAS